MMQVEEHVKQCYAVFLLWRSLPPAPEVTSLSFDCRADQTKRGGGSSLDCRTDHRKRSHPTTEASPKNHSERPGSQYFQFIRSAEPGNNNRVESTTIAKPATPIRSLHRIIAISTTRPAQRFKRGACEPTYQISSI